MKIAVNAFSARVGGGQTYLRNLFSHLPTRPDLEVLILGGNELRLPPQPGVRLVHPRWPTTNPLLRAAWERFALPRWLKREGVHLLFCPGGIVPPHTPSKCRTATMFRNMLPFDAAQVGKLPWGYLRLRLLALRQVMLRSMSRADLTIFISDHARKVVESQIRVPAAVTIPHGISELFRTKGRPLPRPANAPKGDYILYVSRFESYKRHAELVRAYAELEESLRSQHPLLLLGEKDLPDAIRTAALISSLGLESQVSMPGAAPYEALPGYYQHARVVVFVSACENCPNILLEALASGRPIVCSDVMPMPEFGGDGLIYCAPDSPTSIAGALRKALLDPAHADKAGAAAIERSRVFDWRRTAGETWARLFELCDQSADTGTGDKVARNH